MSDATRQTLDTVEDFLNSEAAQRDAAEWAPATRRHAAGLLRSLAACVRTRLLLAADADAAAAMALAAMTPTCQHCTMPEGRHHWVCPEFRRPERALAAAGAGR